MKRFLSSLILAFFILGHGTLQGHALAPEELVTKLAADMTSVIRNDPALQTGNVPKLSAVAEQTLGMRFDFERITRSAAGRNWNKASAEEKAELIKQFSKLLIRTYAGAISNLKDLDVRVKGSRVNAPDKDVTVRTEMVGRPQRFQRHVRRADQGDILAFAHDTGLAQRHGEIFLRHRIGDVV